MPESEMLPDVMLCRTENLFIFSYFSLELSFGSQRGETCQVHTEIDMSPSAPPPEPWEDLTPSAPMAEVQVPISDPLIGKRLAGEPKPPLNRPANEKYLKAFN